MRCRVKKKKNEYVLNWVPPETTQQEYYENFRGIIAEFVGQCNCDAAILAYGATGSGKTFSTQGPDLTRRAGNVTQLHSSHLALTAGIIQRAIEQILQVRHLSYLLPHTCAPVLSTGQTQTETNRAELLRRAGCWGHWCSTSLCCGGLL